MDALFLVWNGYFVVNCNYFTLIIDSSQKKDIGDLSNLDKHVNFDCDSEENNWVCFEEIVVWEIKYSIVVFATTRIF